MSGYWGLKSKDRCVECDCCVEGVTASKCDDVSIIFFNPLVCTSSVCPSVTLAAISFISKQKTSTISFYSLRVNKHRFEIQ